MTIELVFFCTKTCSTHGKYILSTFMLQRCAKMIPVVSYQWCCCTYRMSAINNSVTPLRVKITGFVGDVTNTTSGNTSYIRKNSANGTISFIRNKFRNAERKKRNIIYTSKL